MAIPALELDLLFDTFPLASRYNSRHGKIAQAVSR